MVEFRRSIGHPNAVARLRFRPLFRLAITGRSMLPTLRNGDRVLVLAARRLRVGDLVAIRDPRRPERTIVKRVTAADSLWVTVAGDNAGGSTDSRHFGPVPRSLVRGRVIYRYAPASRAGRPR